jgi:hypothetical protein
MAEFRVIFLMYVFDDTISQLLTLGPSVTNLKNFVSTAASGSLQVSAPLTSAMTRPPLEAEPRLQWSPTAENSEPTMLESIL